MPARVILHVAERFHADFRSRGHLALHGRIAAMIERRGGAVLVAERNTHVFRRRSRFDPRDGRIVPEIVKSMYSDVLVFLADILAHIAPRLLKRLDTGQCSTPYSRRAMDRVSTVFGHRALLAHEDPQRLRHIQLPFSTVTLAGVAFQMHVRCRFVQLPLAPAHAQHLGQTRSGPVQHREHDLHLLPIAHFDGGAPGGWIQCTTIAVHEKGFELVVFEEPLDEIALRLVHKLWRAQRPKMLWVTTG